MTVEKKNQEKKNVINCFDNYIIGFFFIIILGSSWPEDRIATTVHREINSSTDDACPRGGEKKNRTSDGGPWECPASGRARKVSTKGKIKINK